MCHGELARRRPAAALPHRLLHVDFGRRHDRRHRDRPDRAACVQLGRRISAADRARAAVPAGPRAAGARQRAILRCSWSAVVAAVLLFVLRGRSTSASTHRMYARDRSACCSGLTVQFWRAPLPFAAIVAFLLFANLLQRLDHQRSSWCATSSACSTSSRRPTASFRVLWHGTTAQGTQRIRDDEGNLLKGRPEMIVGILRRRRHRADRRRGARKRRADRSTSR